MIKNFKILWIRLQNEKENWRKMISVYRSLGLGQIIQPDRGTGAKLKDIGTCSLEGWIKLQKRKSNRL